ncbi:DUF565 domain-containing protein [Geminocystis sp. GBBB08]|uniref:DUF565 domain-containing protein n=1 Tax=Geminocystis sp. GBBB08 TaxID=2604140 RepID=UPI0027E353D5|nr:DUF565 domain-containing protein [Geminocystis sp. GBBB08]MBL1209039.1 DUF565 domain-containing protein [Geminocystis sp. GBBB08]
MQQTRLNLLITTLINQFVSFLVNPWRKLSFIIISLLLGYFLANILTTSAGQLGRWDVSIALIFLLFTEFSSMFIYRRSNSPNKSPWLDLLNSLKIGFIYGLYLEALKLGS